MAAAASISSRSRPYAATVRHRVTDNGGGAVDASTEGGEAFAEVVVPVLRDWVLADRFDIEGAVRYSNYNTIGSTWAWKLGAEWAPIEDVRLRFTRSRSVRAPNIVELFAPDTLGTLNITADPCDAAEINLAPNRLANCRALGIPAGWVDPAFALALRTQFGGNPDLSEETRNSWTAGAVVSPLDGLRLSVDYRSIKIDDAIQTLDGNSIVDKCVDSPTLDNAFCPLVTRGSFVGLSDPYVISSIDLRQVNIRRLTASGVDIDPAGESHAQRFILDAAGQAWIVGLVDMGGRRAVDRHGDQAVDDCHRSFSCAAARLIYTPSSPTRNGRAGNSSRIRSSASASGTGR